METAERPSELFKLHNRMAPWSLAKSKPPTYLSLDAGVRPLSSQDKGGGLSSWSLPFGSTGDCAPHSWLPMSSHCFTADLAQKACLCP